MKLLSICIPTYNRADFLPETLESIFRQWRDDIEVTVADNASTDATAGIVERYRRRFGAVRYFCWDSNQGADRNYLKAVELADGRYCWILGSDDPIAPDAVDLLCRKIQASEPGIVLFNRLLCTKEMAPLKEDRFLDIAGEAEATFDFRRQGELREYLRNARSICATFSYLSSMAFAKAAWDSVPTDEKLVGTAYVHVQKLLGVCRARATLLYLNRALVHCRLGNDAFRDLGLARRVLLDLNGYQLLAERCFGPGELDCAEALLEILAYEYPFGRIMRYQGVLGRDPQWPEILRMLKGSYRWPAWKLALATWLGRSKALVALSFSFRDAMNKQRPFRKTHPLPSVP